MVATRNRSAAVDDTNHGHAYSSRQGAAGIDCGTSANRKNGPVTASVSGHITKSPRTFLSYVAG